MFSSTVLVDSHRLHMGIVARLPEPSARTSDTHLSPPRVPTVRLTVVSAQGSRSACGGARHPDSHTQPAWSQVSPHMRVRRKAAAPSPRRVLPSPLTIFRGLCSRAGNTADVPSSPWAPHDACTCWALTSPSFLSLACLESLSLLPAVGLSPTQHILPGERGERCSMALALQLSISFLKMSLTGVFL